MLFIFLKVRAYGEVEVHESIAGAEALLKSSKTIDVGSDDDDSASNDGEWVDVSHSEGEDGSDAEEDEDENDSDEQNDSDDDEDDDEEDDEEEEESDSDDDQEQNNANDNKNSTNNSKSSNKTPKKPASVTSEASSKKSMKILDEKQAAQELALTRIFTDEDFKRINTANLKKTVTNARKRPLERDRQEFVKLDNIEMIYKKRKHDKESRLETVKAGREGREKFGWKDGRKNENSSKTNREKRKTKNFTMLRYKARSKLKKSFKDKQQAMRKHLLHQKKMK